MKFIDYGTTAREQTCVLWLYPEDSVPPHLQQDTPSKAEVRKQKSPITS